MERVADFVDLSGLRGILATSLDAVVVCDADGVIVEWNECAKRTFGWDRVDAIGSLMELLIVPDRHRQAHGAGMRRVAAGHKPRILNRRLNLSALHMDGREFPVEMAVTPIGEDKDRLYVGFIRDTTERYEAERELKRRATEAELVAHVSTLAGEAPTFEDALAQTLEAILELTGWQVAHAFDRPNANPVLASSGVWVERQEGQAAELRRLTQETVFVIGKGMPGLILQTGEPVWIEDIDGDPRSARRGSGFGSAFGFPLKSEGLVIAILEFFSNQRVPPDTEVMRTVQVLGEQLGRALERKRTADRQQLLVHELNHRVKNTFAVVQGIVSQTLTADRTIEEARAALDSRLLTVSAANDLLIAENWTKASITRIIRSATGGCGVPEDRCTISGQDFDVRPATAVSIALAIHELCTNAYKYGALSVPKGHVDVSWTLDHTAEPLFRFEWRERDGPPVTPPTRKGFGSRLLERGLTHEVGGSAHFDFQPEGLVFVFTAVVNPPVPQPIELTS